MRISRTIPVATNTPVALTIGNFDGVHLGHQATLERLPRVVQDGIQLIGDWTSAESEFDAVVHHGSAQERIDIARKIAARDGPIVSIHGFAPGEPPFAIERLLVERVVSVNTAAAGGNASLMTVG